MSEKKCPACGAALDLNASECKYCGEAIAVHNQEYQQGQQRRYQGNQSQYQSQNPYAYLKPYYQYEFQQMSSSDGSYKGKWNWCAFFFSWIWAFTKGLWGLGLVGLGISIFLRIIDADLSILYIAVSIFFGLRGNYFYYNLIENKKQFPNQ